MSAHHADIIALRQALRDFSRYDAQHADDCQHRYCDDAPCLGGDCEAGDDLDPCSPTECFAEAASRLVAAAQVVLDKLESAR